MNQTNRYHHTPLLALLLVTFGLLIGCTPEIREAKSGVAPSPGKILLNSERIRQKFGSYGIDVLVNGAELRISNLYSQENSSRITRTLAWVQYPRSVHASFAKEHARVVAGQSIGEVFKGTGWTITKLHRYFGKIDIPKGNSTALQLFHRRETAQFAIHIYDFRISKPLSDFHYVTIAEIHHPDYLTLNDLSEIYPVEFPLLRQQTKPISKLLGALQNDIQNL